MAKQKIGARHWVVQQKNLFTSSQKHSDAGHCKAHFFFGGLIPFWQSFSVWFLKLWVSICVLMLVFGFSARRSINQYFYFSFDFLLFGGDGDDVFGPGPGGGIEGYSSSGHIRCVPTVHIFDRYTY
jgi:hypothetical protein